MSEEEKMTDYPEEITFPTRKLEIHHVSISGGDATLILIKNNEGKITKSVILDLGADRSGDPEIVKGYANLIGIKKFDYAIISHYHRDHFKGLKYDEIYYASLIQASDSRHTKEAKKLTNNKNVNGDSITNATITNVKDELTKHKTPYKITLSETSKPPITLTCYYANGVLANGNKVDLRKKGKKHPDENDQSLVWILQYKNFSYFTAGDLSGETSGKYNNVEAPVFKYLFEDEGYDPSDEDYENRMKIDSSGAFTAEITAMKASHHGSRHSSFGIDGKSSFGNNDSLFFHYMKPKFMIIPCNNHHLLPFKEFYQRVNKIEDKFKPEAIHFVNEFYRHTFTKNTNALLPNDPIFKNIKNDETKLDQSELKELFKLNGISYIPFKDNSKKFQEFTSLEFDVLKKEIKKTNKNNISNIVLYKDLIETVEINKVNKTVAKGDTFVNYDENKRHPVSIITVNSDGESTIDISHEIDLKIKGKSIRKSFELPQFPACVEGVLIDIFGVIIQTIEFKDNYKEKITKEDFFESLYSRESSVDGNTNCDVFKQEQDDIDLELFEAARPLFRKFGLTNLNLDLYFYEYLTSIGTRIILQKHFNKDVSIDLKVAEMIQLRNDWYTQLFKLLYNNIDIYNALPNTNLLNDLKSAKDMSLVKIVEIFHHFKKKGKNVKYDVLKGTNTLLNQCFVANKRKIDANDELLLLIADIITNRNKKKKKRPKDDEGEVNKKKRLDFIGNYQLK